MVDPKTVSKSSHAGIFNQVYALVVPRPEAIVTARDERGRVLAQEQRPVLVALVGQRLDHGHETQVRRAR